MYHGIGIDKKMVKSKRIGKQSYKPLTSDPRFKKEQTIYEHNLGVYSFKDRDAKNALDNTIQKMKNVLIKNYRNKLNRGSETEEKSILNESTGFNKASNPREKMNALYNSIYLASDRDASENNVPNFRDIVLGMGKQKRSEKQKFVTSLGLNDSIIKDRKLASKWTRKKDSNKIVDKSQSMIEKLIRQYLKKHPKPKREENESIEDYQHRLKKHGLQYTVYMGSVFEKFSMGGVYEETKQELEIMLTDKEKEEFYAEIDSLKLFEEETIQQNPKLPRSLRKMESNYNVRITNGISDTAIRMLTIAKWLGLNQKDLLGFRLALMGWLLPTNEHSLWEIIMASHKAGVKGNEDMTDMVSLDQTVDPVSINELRYEVCRNHEGCPMFPHEIVYWEQRFKENPGENEKQVPLGSFNPNNSATIESMSKYIRDNVFKRDGSLFHNEHEHEKIQDWLEGFEAYKRNLALKLSFQNIISLEESFSSVSSSNENFNTIAENNILDNFATRFVPYINNFVTAFKEHNNKTVNQYCNKIITPINRFIQPHYSKDFLEKLKKLIKEHLINNINESLSDNVRDIDKQILDYEKEFNRYSNRVQTASVLLYTSPAYIPMLKAAILKTGNLFKKLYAKKVLNKTYEINKGISEKRDEYINSKSKYRVERNGENKTKFNKAKDIYKKSKKLYATKRKKEEFNNDMLVDNLILNETLRNIHKRFNGEVFRGTWDYRHMSKFKKGKTIKFGDLTSTSKKPTVVINFIQQGPFMESTLLEIEMNGKNGIDLTSTPYNNSNGVKRFDSEYSVYKGQQEVLCLPNTEIQVEEVIDNVNLTGYLFDKNTSKNVKPEILDKTTRNLWKQIHKSNNPLDLSKIKNDERKESIIRLKEQEDFYMNKAHKKFLIGKIVRCKEVGKKDEGK